jgi:hypothetical protein
VSWYVFLALAAINVVTMACVDYAHARYNHALADARRGVVGAEHRAGCWSVGAWIPATICFVVAVKVSLWMLPFETIGLYVGSRWGARFRDAR